MDPTRAREIATRWLGAHPSEEIRLREVDGLWRAWRAGRTSVALVFGDAGGVLAYHIAERTDDDAIRAYREGQRTPPPSDRIVVPDSTGTAEALDEARARLAELLKPYRK